MAWIAEDGNNAAVVEDGRAVVLKPAVRSFASKAWATRRGLLIPFDPQSETELAFDCDRSACSPHQGLSPAIGAWWSRRPPPADRLTALCQASDILVVRAPQPAPDACPHALMLTRADLERGGSAEIFADPTGWRVGWAESERGRRPWSEPATSVSPLSRSLRRADPAIKQPVEPMSEPAGLSDNGG